MSICVASSVADVGEFGRRCLGRKYDRCLSDVAGMHACSEVLHTTPDVSLFILESGCMGAARGRRCMRRHLSTLR